MFEHTKTVWAYQDNSNLKRWFDMYKQEKNK